LTVAENLRFFGLLYGIASLRNRVEELLQEFDLADLRHTKCGLLSSGEQTRAALAKAMLNHPTLLLLDEPTASLDPSAAQLIRAKIKRHATQGDCGILWTSHNMSEVAEVCDRVLRDPERAFYPRGARTAGATCGARSAGYCVPA
jgi:ABC-2 type transport system ATP-binding protein